MGQIPSNCRRYLAAGAHWSECENSGMGTVSSVERDGAEVTNMAMTSFWMKTGAA